MAPASMQPLPFYADFKVSPGWLNRLRNPARVVMLEPSERGQRRKMKMHYLSILAFLALFWLLLSGHGELFILIFGALSSLLVTLLLVRMDRRDGEPGIFRPGIRTMRYFGWLLWQVILSNIDVARRIWHPSLPIRPSWQRLDTDVSTSLEKTLYANSITLTPGTLTTDVREDHFMIHSLTPEGIEELRKGEMEARIKRLGV